MAERRPDRTLGPGHDDFWRYCESGELRLQKCKSCGNFAWPVVKTCEFCGKMEFSWERMSGRGKVAAWCTFERDYYYGVLPIPWDTIMVELEEGPLFMSNPKGFSWREISTDMPVQLAFIHCEDFERSVLTAGFRARLMEVGAPTATDQENLESVLTSVQG